MYMLVVNTSSYSMIYFSGLLLHQQHHQQSFYHECVVYIVPAKEDEMKYTGC